MITKSILKCCSGKCPIWGVDVSVYGWYKAVEVGRWVFLRAECPIVENAKLPLWKQNPDYRAMVCSHHSECHLYRSFQPETTPDI